MMRMIRNRKPHVREGESRGLVIPLFLKRLIAMENNREDREARHEELLVEAHGAMMKKQAREKRARVLDWRKKYIAREEENDQDIIARAEHEFQMSKTSRGK